MLYLENYDWELGALLTQGVNLWVNTPLRPYEASGTSGMKAALNGVPSLSVLDGWWIEGCAENLTGWAIERADTEEGEAASLYDKLENLIAPLYQRPSAWARMQQHCIGINGTFFNTHRMLGQYYSERVLPADLARGGGPDRGRSSGSRCEVLRRQGQDRLSPRRDRPSLKVQEAASDRSMIGSNGLALFRIEHPLAVP